MESINSEGNLTPGLHYYTFSDFKKQFIDDFKTSQTRGIILNCAMQWFLLIYNKCPPVEVWLDGSFVTNKQNPNDLDLVLFFDKSLLTHDLVNNIKYHISISSSYKCDSYSGIINNNSASGDDINNRNYWRGQFGFDRLDRPKGIIILTWEEVIFGIKEVLGDVL